MATPNLALARPTVNLAGGLRPGFWYWVDLDSDYVQERIGAGQIVLAEQQPEAVPLPPADDEAKVAEGTGEEQVGIEIQPGEEAELPDEGSGFMFGRAIPSVEERFPLDALPLDETDALPLEDDDSRPAWAP